MALSISDGLGRFGICEIHCDIVVEYALCFAAGDASRAKTIVGMYSELLGFSIAAGGVWPTMSHAFTLCSETG